MESKYLEAFIWTCGFSKWQAFIQAEDGGWWLEARLKPVAAVLGAVCVCLHFRRRESACESFLMNEQM